MQADGDKGMEIYVNRFKALLDLKQKLINGDDINEDVEYHCDLSNIVFGLDESNNYGVYHAPVLHFALLGGGKKLVYKN